MGVNVVTSTVSDGSLYNRKDMFDSTVINNRTKFFMKQGIKIDNAVRLKVQYETKDFCRYLTVTAKDKGKGVFDDNIQASDVLITQTPGLGLFVPVADCIGATFFDPVNQVLALAHLGRHSLEQNGAFKIVKHLEALYGSLASNMQIWLTPAAGASVYPIWALDNKGMKEATHEQLAAGGILIDNIQDNTAETTSDQRYFSYSEYLKGHRSEDGDHGMLAWIEPTVSRSFQSDQQQKANR